MAGYAPALLDEIRGAIDVVDLVGRFVTLRKAGVNWKGLCPFHGEKTPSFMVNPRKGIFHCFGCGVGGDAFGFLMKQDRLSFPEAVRALARTAGVALPEERPSEADSGREDLFRVMELAARFYAEMLWKAGGERGRQYLEGRGVAPEVAKHFGLGLAPDAWDGLLAMMRAEKVAVERLEAAGLVKPRPNGGGHYDAFRGRLIFPIRDLQGHTVAFGGRGFDADQQPKYLNSPETPIYTKGNLLYAVDLARPTIRDNNRALLVEGYLDCIMAHQHGFTETVAALGTAFTPAQLGILRRYCDEVVTFFDADAAGQKAAERAAELLEPSALASTWGVNRTGALETAGGFRVKVALLSGNHDPDTFLREHGADAFRECIAHSRSLLAYALDRAIADADGAGGARARTNAFARAALMLAKVADAQEAAELSREAALKLGVDPTQLWIEAQKLQSALARPGRTTAAPAASTEGKPTPRERDLVRLLVHSTEARVMLLPILEDGDVKHPPLTAIVGALARRPDAPAEALLIDLPDDASRGVLAEMLVVEAEPAAVGDLIGQFATHLEREHRQRQQREITRAITEGGKDGAAELPHGEYAALHEHSKVVYELAGGVAQSLPSTPTVNPPRSAEE
jgi:DNA primase